jgi:single-strand DNA-binding protein
MIITGIIRLGADAELRYTPKGDAVINLRGAYNYGNKDQDGKRPTQWIDIEFWGKRAEDAAPNMLKGTAVSITALNPHIEEYQGKNGKGHKLSARLLDFEYTGSRPAGDEKPAASKPAAPNSAPKTGGGSGGAFDDFSDDIPFATCHHDLTTGLKRRMRRYE